MKVIYGKILNKDEIKVVSHVADSCGILFDTARLLFYRGIDNVESAKRFLAPSKKGFYNPYLLKGMHQAVERIKLAKDRGERVMIFGDYDADGVCATSVLYYCLLQFGVTPSIYVPEREEGYGINVQTIKRFNDKDKIDLLITVDCGVSDHDKIVEINRLGVDVIVTDHHEPPEILPDCVTINPKIEGQEYPFNGLCGAGVAYKLGYALIGEKADEQLDLVALATVADSMELIDENRDIVYEGLKLFNNARTLRPQFKYLIGENTRQITAQTIAYSIAPRINAGGRMGDANSALELFTSQDSNRIFDLAVKLGEYNLARQVECDNIYKEAKEKIKKLSLSKRDVIMVKDAKWSAGFIGIVAAKLVEDYSRPVIVFAGQDGHYKGSARSIDGVNIHDAITASKGLLLGFGGHSQAAGVSVENHNFIKFESAVNNYIKNEYGKMDTEKKVFAEWNVDKPFSIRFAKEIEGLEPFGVGNRRPLFTIDVKSIRSQPLKAGSQHYTFKTDLIEILDFNGEGNVDTLALPIDKKVLFELNLSTFRGKESLKGYARQVFTEDVDFSQLKLDIFENELNKLLEQKEADYIKIGKHEVNFFGRSGDVYLISDPDNLSRYKGVERLPINVFSCLGKSCVGNVIVSPKAIPEDAERVIYLDKPLIAIESEIKTLVVEEIIGYKFLDQISTDRSDFAKIFNFLITCSGKVFNSGAEFTRRFCGDENPYTFLFVTKVFMELGIFTIRNGVFTFDEKVKNALTNSKLYSKIYLLKGSL